MLQGLCPFRIKYIPAKYMQVLFDMHLHSQGVLGGTAAPVRQLFERFSPADAASDAEARFEYFKKPVWLRIRESGSAGKTCRVLQLPGVAVCKQTRLRHTFIFNNARTAALLCYAKVQCFDSMVWLTCVSACAGQLIFVPSYFDFVRLRNFLKGQEAQFVGLSEYAKTSDVSRGRSHFYHGRRRIMLYTERSHFYNRHFIRGVQVCKSLAAYPH